MVVIGLFSESKFYFFESLFSLLANSVYFLHRLHRVDVDFSVVFDGLVSFLFEIENTVVYYLLAVGFAIGFGPLHLLRIMLGLEMFVALGPAKAENFAIIPHENHPMAGVNTARTKVAFLNSH